MLDRTLKMSDTAEPAHVLRPKTHTVINANLDGRSPRRKRERACGATQQETGEQARLTLEAARSETGSPSSKKPGQEVESLEQELKGVDEQLEQVRQELKNIRDTTKCSTTPNTTQAQPLNKSTVGNSHLWNIPNVLLDYADMCKRSGEPFGTDRQLIERLYKFKNWLTKSTFPPTDSCTLQTDLTPTTGYAKDDLLKLPNWAKDIFWKKAQLGGNRNVLVQNAKEQVHRDDMPTCLEWLEQDKWRKEFASEAFTRLSPQVQLFFVELMKGTWRDHSATAKEQFVDYNIEQERVRRKEEEESCSKPQGSGNSIREKTFNNEWDNMMKIRLDPNLERKPRGLRFYLGKMMRDDPYMQSLAKETGCEQSYEIRWVQLQSHGFTRLHQIRERQQLRQRALLVQQ
jgi:hypothetical protein